jgi:hypothetical protein
MLGRYGYTNAGEGIWIHSNKLQKEARPELTTFGSITVRFLEMANHNAEDLALEFLLRCKISEEEIDEILALV